MIEFAGKEFFKMSGETEIFGDDGPLFQYTVYIQNGIGVDRKRATRRIDVTLADPRSWIRSGNVRFQRVDEGADTDCFIAGPNVVDILCAPLKTEGKVSCCMGRNVVLNVLRWMNAVPHWTGSLNTYRQMVINHEFGHRIGRGHGYCPGPGKLAPVMQQQTYGLQGCRENSWPLDSELP